MSGLFDIFKIGIGPSSSHTMGPMLAARRFAQTLTDLGVLSSVHRIKTVLYGSLGATGRGHKTDTAIIIGLHGVEPAELDPDRADALLLKSRETASIVLPDGSIVGFNEDQDILFEPRTVLSAHPNAMTLEATTSTGERLASKTYYSVGGGFVLSEDEIGRNLRPGDDLPTLPNDFKTGDELLQLCADRDMNVADLVMENECAMRPEAEVLAYLDRIWEVMDDCIRRGCKTPGILPGGLKVKRRAPTLFASLIEKRERALGDPLAALDWINLWAMAVNEENAAGARVVTAPTNGAAGIIPAVLRYYTRFHAEDRAGIHTFLLTAAAIGTLYKRNASISGAEVGCQGEVGVACSMAAAGLTATLGGSALQIENAAEIGMEHNLGLTCDPIGGLVQIPCIERNAMGAVKAIDASRLALIDDGEHLVSLDSVIETMRQTGLDMASKYKETSEGGLAVNVPEC